MRGLVLFASLAGAFCLRAPSKCVNNGQIALVFSDGPVEGTTQVLGALDDESMKATFMCSTVNIDHPGVADVIKDMASSGHTVGLRTNPIYSFSDMDETSIKDAISGELEVLEEIVGEKVKYITVNQEDVNNQDVLQVIDDLGLVLINYNYDMYGLDDDREDMLKRWELKLKTVRPQNTSYIVLQHDQRESELEILPEVVSSGRERGFEFVNMEECLQGADMGGDVDGGSGATIVSRNKAEKSGALAQATLAACFVGMLAL